VTTADDEVLRGLAPPLPDQPQKVLRQLFGDPQLIFVSDPDRRGDGRDLRGQVVPVWAPRPIR
jgi:hypothetical protein